MSVGDTATCLFCEAENVIIGEICEYYVTLDDSGNRLIVTFGEDGSMSTNTQNDSGETIHWAYYEDFNDATPLEEEYLSGYVTDEAEGTVRARSEGQCVEPRIRTSKFRFSAYLSSVLTKS